MCFPVLYRCWIYLTWDCFRGFVPLLDIPCKESKNIHTDSSSRSHITTIMINLFGTGQKLIQTPPVHDCYVMFSVFGFSHSYRIPWKGSTPSFMIPNGSIYSNSGSREVVFGQQPREPRSSSDVVGGSDPLLEERSVRNGRWDGTGSIQTMERSPPKHISGTCQ